MPCSCPKLLLYCMMLPWIVEAFCDLVADVLQSNVCVSVYIRIHSNEK